MSRARAPAPRICSIGSSPRTVCRTTRPVSGSRGERHHRHPGRWHDRRHDGGAESGGFRPERRRRPSPGRSRAGRTPFDGGGLIASPPVTSGSVASVSVTGLARARGYHWRARAIDDTDATSASWVSFGGEIRKPRPTSWWRHRSCSPRPVTARTTPTSKRSTRWLPTGRAPCGSTTNATVDTDPSLSPDGTRIVFESNRDGDYEIFVMDVDGTDPVKLTDNTAVASGSGLVAGRC